ncbi:hypothetical protein SCHPADRAFT_933724, partial [Schizopora paradoxa]
MQTRTNDSNVGNDSNSKDKQHTIHGGEIGHEDGGGPDCIRFEDEQGVQWTGFDNEEFDDEVEKSEDDNAQARDEPVEEHETVRSKAFDDFADTVLQKSSIFCEQPDSSGPQIGCPANTFARAPRQPPKFNCDQVQPIAVARSSKIKMTCTVLLQCRDYIVDSYRSNKLALSQE